LVQNKEERSFVVADESNSVKLLNSKNVHNTNGDIMKNTKQIQHADTTTDTITNQGSQTVHNATSGGGLSVRTDLRAGLSWDELDSQAQELWNNLTNTISNVTGGDTSS